jgi:hypothetical protein
VQVCAVSAAARISLHGLARLARSSSIRPRSGSSIPMVIRPPVWSPRDRLHRLVEPGALTGRKRFDQRLSEAVALPVERPPRPQPFRGEADGADASVAAGPLGSDQTGPLQRAQQPAGYPESNSSAALRSRTSGPPGPPPTAVGTRPKADQDPDCRCGPVCPLWTEPCHFGGHCRSVRRCTPASVGDRHALR